MAGACVGVGVVAVGALVAALPPQAATKMARPAARASGRTRYEVIGVIPLY